MSSYLRSLESLTRNSTCIIRLSNAMHFQIMNDEWRSKAFTSLHGLLDFFGFLWISLGSLSFGAAVLQVFKRSTGEGVGRSARAGEATARRGILIQSLISSTAAKDLEYWNTFSTGRVHLF